jgi:hypothetical protein
MNAVRHFARSARVGPLWARSAWVVVSLVGGAAPAQPFGQQVGPRPPARLVAAGPATAPATPADPATRPPATGPATVAATRPASGPSSQPATSPAGSLDSPRASLKWFAAALRDGDASQLRKVVFTASDAEDHMVGAMGEMAHALASLHRAAVAAFGPEAATRFTDDTAAHFDQTVARIDAADVATDGDVATVRYAEDKDNPFTLRKVKDQWRIPASQFAGGAMPDVVERRAAEMLVQARIVTEVARDIAAAKYRTADAASLAWRSKMMSALGGPPAPATRQ